MNKRYVLYARIKDSKYEGFYRYAFKLFENYHDLQKHLHNYWFVEKNNYVIFEETDLGRDYSCCDGKRGKNFI